MTLSITVIPEIVQDLPPRNKVTITSTNTAPNAVPNNSKLTLIRIHQDGSEHPVLTPSDPRVGNGTALLWDYHSPYNQLVSYRVEAAGATALSSSVVISNQAAWLIHPSDPSLSVCVDFFTEIAARQIKSRAGRFEVQGSLPIFISDGTRGSMEGSVSIFQSEYERVEKLLDDDQVILINTPGTPGWRVKWIWVQFSQATFEAPGGVRVLEEKIALPWEESQQPDADLLNPWNAGAAAAYFHSIGVNAGGVKARYANALALKTNTPL